MTTRGLPRATHPHLLEYLGWFLLVALTLCFPDHQIQKRWELYLRRTIHSLANQYTNISWLLKKPQRPMWMTIWYILLSSWQGDPLRPSSKNVWNHNPACYISGAVQKKTRQEIKSSDIAKAAVLANPQIKAPMLANLLREFDTNALPSDRSLRRALLELKKPKSMVDN